MANLSVEIRNLNRISVYNPKSPDASTGKICCGRATQAACSYDKDLGGTEM